MLTFRIWILGDFWWMALQNNTNYIFDVYNNGHDFGGKIRVVFDRYISLSDEFFSVTDSTFHSKISARKNLGKCNCQLIIYFWFPKDFATQRSYRRFQTSVAPFTFEQPTSTPSFKPFNGSIWITFGSMIIVFGLLLKLLFRYEGIESKTISTFILALGVLCQQGTDGRIFLLSSRCLIFC